VMTTVTGEGKEVWKLEKGKEKEILIQEDGKMKIEEVGIKEETAIAIRIKRNI
jgi:hypothetical protein